MTSTKSSDGPKVVGPLVAKDIAQGVTLVLPLSRKGSGPGLILLVPNEESAAPIEIEDGIPSVRMKWAEEGYCIVEIRPQASPSAIETALDTLSSCAECQPKEKLGVVCYDTAIWSKHVASIGKHAERFVAAALYTRASEYAAVSSHISVPAVVHVTGKLETKAQKTKTRVVYEYATQQSCFFPVPFHKDFHYSTEAVSHSRNLSFLKPRMDGPYFDLEAIWEEHTYYEFEAREVENTMNTMVAEPYVNHIPTVTGGIGRQALTDFYRNHFVFSNPKDTELELISRTVGIDRVVDEFIYKFTHDRIIDWLLPGVPPTHKYIEIPFMAVVNVRGDRLYHEHIHWDQASALRQVGLLPETLSLTIPADTSINGKANGSHATGTQRYEVTLPATGTDTVKKMRDKNSVPSNEMFSFQAKRSVE